MYSDTGLIQVELPYEQLRSLILEQLKTSKTGQTTSLSTNVARLVVQKNLAPDPYANSGMLGNLQYKFTPKYNVWVEDIVWDLINEGVIRPGLLDDLNKGLPYYHLSEYGNSIVENQQAQPYDPEGYLADVRSIPHIDPVIVTYLEESLKAFRINCLLSSAITVGCASEKAILLLLDACINAVNDPTLKARLTKVNDGLSTKQKQDELKKILDTKILIKNSIVPYDVREDLDNYLTGVFGIIRKHRNDAGHPTGKIIRRPDLNALLVVFPEYLKKIYSLMNWFNANHNSL